MNIMQGKAIRYVRVTCEQLAALRETDRVKEVAANQYLFCGYPIVTRGSIADCNFRESKPRVPHLDLTKEETV